MKSRLACIAAALLFLQPLAAQYRTALPGYRYEFPRDHFNHPDFQTEWWYYTGNLKSADGRRFGFELTFFRQAISRDPAKAGTWDVKDIYLAHLALSDLDGGKIGRASCRSEEHTSELQSPDHLVCRLLLEKKKQQHTVSYRISPLSDHP